MWWLCLLADRCPYWHVSSAVSAVKLPLVLTCVIWCVGVFVTAVSAFIFVSAVSAFRPPLVLSYVYCLFACCVCFQTAARVDVCVFAVAHCLQQSWKMLVIASARDKEGDVIFRFAYSRNVAIAR